MGNEVKDLGIYFLEMARMGHTIEADEEESPTELNTINSSGGFLVISTDKLSVHYPSVNLHGHDVGVVQANRPAPVKRFLYYFEITVRNAGAKGQIAVGYTTESFKMCRQPGWEVNSYGYHGDDGFLYRGHGKGEAFGPTYTTGDTIGSGINYASQVLFFTKNGVIVGKTYKDVKGPLFPTVAVHSQHEEVCVNFGKDPFKFNLEEYEAEERVKLLSLVEKIPIPEDISHRLVRAYLLHYGHEETLRSFDVAVDSTVPRIKMADVKGSNEPDCTFALNERKTLRQLIRDGRIDEAVAKLREWYPHVVEDDQSAVCFLLHCQKFIELVRVGELEGAIEYGRSALAKYFRRKEFEELVQDCVALLAYEDPESSSVGYLLRESQREIVADMVNALVLAGTSCAVSHLEKLLRQLTACCSERRILDGDQGERFHIRRLLFLLRPLTT